MHQLPSDAVNEVNKHVNRLSTHIQTTREMAACKQYPHLCFSRLMYEASVFLSLSLCVYLAASSTFPTSQI